MYNRGVLRLEASKVVVNTNTERNGMEGIQSNPSIQLHWFFLLYTVIIVKRSSEARI